MDVLQMMKEMTEQLIAVEDRLNKLDQEKEALEVERDALKSKLDFGKSVADYYESKFKDEAMHRTEALATLYISDRTDGDFKTFCEQTLTELPEEINPPPEEEGEETAATVTEIGQASN